MANWTKTFVSGDVTVSVSDKAAVMVKGGGKTCVMLDNQFLAIATLPRELLAEIVEYTLQSQGTKKEAKEQARMEKEIERLQKKNEELKAAIAAKQGLVVVRKA